jgi:hypothetical protein
MEYLLCLLIVGAVASGSSGAATSFADEGSSRFSTSWGCQNDALIAAEYVRAVLDTAGRHFSLHPGDSVDRHHELQPVRRRRCKPAVIGAGALLLGAQ